MTQHTEYHRKVQRDMGRSKPSYSVTYSKADSGCPAGLCLECPLPDCKNDSPAAYKVYADFMRTVGLVREQSSKVVCDD